MNVSVLGEAEGNTGYLGQILPSASGTQDFRFYLYGKSGKNNRESHIKESENGEKYSGIVPLAPRSIE